MAKFGIDGIRYFGNARANDVSTAEDLTYVFNICNGLDDRLRSAGHERAFYWANQNCWETDMRDADKGGNDVIYADNVDLFFVLTHGNNDDGVARLLFDTPMERWRTHSRDWQLGENWNLEWMLVYGCHTVDLNNVAPLWSIFSRLHVYCGAWGDMWDSITTDEVGEDVGDNLIDGQTVSQAWIDGVSDWAVDNHPITICVGDAATWNNGNIRWELSYFNRDHLWGHGNTEPDLPPERQACILWRWAEG